MSFFERLMAALKREGSDARDALRDVGRRIDDALAAKEEELAATPSERVDMILEESKADEARFDELEQRIRGEAGGQQPDSD